MFKLAIFEIVTQLRERVDQLEKQVESLQKEHAQLKLQHQIVSLKLMNNLPITAELVLQGIPYQDLSPQEGFKIYSDPNQSFHLLDVSSMNYSPPIGLKSVIKIPLNELENRCHEIAPKMRNVIVISEDGSKSILACQKLIQLGFPLVYNISGGYRFWPESK